MRMRPGFLRLGDSFSESLFPPVSANNGAAVALPHEEVISFAANHQLT